jgi:anaerobic selenocysteine-containing dehydrogenase
LKVEVEGQRIVRVEILPLNKATAAGPCLKGLSYVERVHSAERILFPMRKLRDGSFARISWDEALDEIVSRLKDFRERFGARSVLYYQASGTKGLLNGVGASFWRLFGGYTGTYGDLCWPAGLEATRLTLGDNKHNAPWDLENARLIVLWGKNPAETNVQQMLAIDRAQESGARLVVVDPRRTLSAERAELLIQPRPGTDGALALGLARILIERGWIDRDFVDNYILGFSRFAEIVEDYSLERVSAITDVPAAAISRLAEMMGNVEPMSVCAGFGMQRYTNSGQTMRAILALVTLTGNIGKPGAGWIYANLQSAVFDLVKDPVAFFPPQEDDGVARISISTARLGPDMMAQKDPELKMAWVERGNPIPQNPETPKVLEAFRRLEFRVVVEQFLTDTAQEADLVLPAKSMFEQTDVIGAYWHPYIQLKQKVMDPPGEVRPESEIYWELARRLGIDEALLKGAIPAPGDDSVEAFLEEKLAPFDQLSLERLAKGPVLAPGTEEVAFGDLRFPTPSGKIELYSEEAAERWGLDPLPLYREAEESRSKRYPLYFMTPNTKDRIHSQFNNLKLIRQFSREPLLHIGPEDARERWIKQGDRVRVFNDRGRLDLKAYIDLSLKRGCVVVTNGWWIRDGGAVNLLSAARETDMGFGAAFHDNMVDVEKLRENSV